ncbi:MAG TPA: DegT/DnrJ/EryC1/StrS aminotransferase family protein [Synergistaceae bacterium]|nr:DegT/DnrJ/EryC1/StrS aminotransferase family protein [Synergistaceae bacterium]
MTESYLPFARPHLEEAEIQEVVDSLRSGWITTGPKVQRFEKDFAAFLETPFALGVSSATAGLHLALLALGVGEGDEVITTPMTFVATVNAILMAGGTPVLADVDPRTWNISPEEVERRITPKTKGILPVHFTGRPCDMKKLNDIAEKHDLFILEDAAHALGSRIEGEHVARGKGRKRMGVFSLHPAKNITTGEGGMVCTEDEDLAESVSILRQHGMSKGAWKRFSSSGTPEYDVLLQGWKANMMDIQAALGLHQLPRLEEFNRIRRQIVGRYLRELEGCPGLELPAPEEKGTLHAWHIFTPLVLEKRRSALIEHLRNLQIGTGIHYIAVHCYKYYQDRFGWHREEFPQATRISDAILSLPLFPDMSENEISRVIRGVRSFFEGTSA